METFQALLTRKLAEALDRGRVCRRLARSRRRPMRVSAITKPTPRSSWPSSSEKIRARSRREYWTHTTYGTYASRRRSPAPASLTSPCARRRSRRRTAELLRDERLGVEQAATPKRIVIDFGSPNVAKPMHVGHIRSTVLGDALARIASFLGHDVIRDNHIGDWGTQFGMVIYGWKNLLDRAALERDPIAELVRIYKETNEKATADPTVREAVREELVKLQAGDPENFSIWKETVDLSLKEFERAYQVLDIHYDIQRGESFYNDRLPAVVERLLKSKIAEISEGAVCVFFRDIPELAEKPAIIRKSDGGFNYATTDIATVDYRIQDLKADTVWLVVGAPQILHFKQIIAIARREGYTADFRHITFGSILGEDRKLMKTRSGENVPLRDLLDEAVAACPQDCRREEP